VQALRAAIETLGIALDERAFERFTRYRELLLAANARFNLTRITDPVEIEMRLFADSLALLPLIPAGAVNLLDIGSGGGLPGLALAIALPELPIDLLDATAKKARFLDDTARELELTQVRAMQGRAEDLGRNPDFRERYAVVTARAVARLVTLAELALPLVAPGGVALLPKGGAAAQELTDARYAIGMLGGRARRPLRTPLPGTTIIAIAKHKPTPAQFPRRPGIPNKTPLSAPRDFSAK
jgi:16S rRNA (guanine527-N7)-methyltransferase